MAVRRSVTISGPAGVRLFGGRLAPASLAGSLQLLDAQPSGELRSELIANRLPQWAPETPATLGPFVLGEAYRVPLAQYVTDPDGDPLHFSRLGGTAPPEVTIDPVLGEAIIPATVPAGTYTVTYDAADNIGVDVAPLGLEGAGAGVPWTFGQVFAEGDVPQHVDAVATGGVLEAFQADVRNRWPDGSAKFAVLSGIGSTGVMLRSVNAPGSSGTVPLGAVQASVSFSSITDHVGASVLPGPVVVTMPNGAEPAVFGADINAHSSGLVRRVDGPVMTEYHYYAPVGSGTHLVVWWHVRAYANGAREVETIVECTPWVAANGGGRRDYLVTVVVGGTARLVDSAVQQYGHTRWSRVDWTGATHQVKPRHDAAYLRRYAFPYNNLGAPSGATNALYGADGSAPLAGNSFEVAMAPPINNPASKLDWANRIGATGTSGSLRTLWESAYAAGVDCYWAAEAHARTAGRWNRIVRDELTGRPFDTMASGNLSRVDVAPYTGSFFVEGAVSNSFSASHHPPFGSGAYLLSGRWAFLEHMQMCANATPLGLATGGTRRIGYRLGGPYNPGTSITPDVRQGAWMQWGYMNCIAWTPELAGGAALPAADAALRLAFVPHVEAFAAGLLAAFRDGTEEGGLYQNNLGIVGWSPGYLNSYIDSASAWGDSFMQNYLCFVVATGHELKLPLSPTGQANVHGLARFALRRVVELGGTNASGWNWRRPYIHLPYGPDEPSGTPTMPPSVWFETWGEVWAAAAAELTSPTDTGDADGLAIFKFRGNDQPVPWDPRTHLDRTEYDYQDNYLKQWSALALAVDLAVPGAAAAWARLQSSSTMTDPRTAANLRNYPVTVYTPRSLG